MSDESADPTPAGDSERPSRPAQPVGPEGQQTRRGPASLWDLLEALDVPVDQRAEAALKPLEDLPIEHLVGLGHARYTRAELVAEADVPEDLADRLWRAMGFADPDRSSRRYTDADLALLRGMNGLLQAGVADEQLAVWTTRVTASPLSRLAEAQAGMLAEQLADLVGGEPRDAEVVQFAEALAEHLMPFLDLMVGHMWRRHLVAALRRRLVMVTGTDGRQRAVGFADLVGSTALGDDRDDREIAEVLDRYEALALDVFARHGVRLVKAIGDEVMFTGPAEDTVEAALALVEACTAQADLPDVRAGVTVGRVAEMAGDLYGVSVNLAARLVERANPGTVVVDGRLAELLPEGQYSVSRFRWKGPDVSGAGEVRPHRVRRDLVARS